MVLKASSILPLKKRFIFHNFLRIIFSKGPYISYTSSVLVKENIVPSRFIWGYVWHFCHFDVVFPSLWLGCYFVGFPEMCALLAASFIFMRWWFMCSKERKWNFLMSCTPFVMQSVAMLAHLLHISQSPLPANRLIFVLWFRPPGLITPRCRPSDWLCAHVSVYHFKCVTCPSSSPLIKQL